MTTMLIFLGIIAIAIIFYAMSRRKAAHHLDKLHITEQPGEKKE